MTRYKGETIRGGVVVAKGDMLTDPISENMALYDNEGQAEEMAEYIREHADEPEPNKGHRHRWVWQKLTRHGHLWMQGIRWWRQCYGSRCAACEFSRTAPKGKGGRK